MSAPIGLLQTSPLLLGLNPDELQALLEASEMRAHRTGELIVSEGQTSDCLFILKRGAVHIEKGDETATVVLAALEQEGDFFGEMSLIDIMPRSADVRAREDTELVALPKRALASFFSSFPRAQMTMILNIARNLSLRLREADLRIVELSRARTDRAGRP